MASEFSFDTVSEFDFQGLRLFSSSKT